MSTSLDQYRIKRAEWFSWYSAGTGELNGIERQIHLMILSEMSSRILIEEQRIRSATKEGLPVLSFVLDGGYLATQVFAIRRLLDKANNVLSLSRVLGEIEASRALITRENFVCFDDTPYEANPTIQEPGFQASDSPFSEAIRSRLRHETFDALAKVHSSARAPSDLIHLDIFERLNNWLFNEAASKLKTIGNKLLAHAATPQSRGDFTFTGLDFVEVERAQENVVKVARAIYDVILVSGVASEVVPATALDFLGTVWDSGEPLTMIPATDQRQKHWDSLRNVRNAWPKNLRSELFT